MRSKSSQPRYLPPIVIQIFGGAIVVALIVYGITTKDRSILLATLGFAGGCVMIGGYYERANRKMTDEVDQEPVELPTPIAIRRDDRRDAQ